MLVLSRKKNESLVINNDITIVIVEIRDDKVRLGIEAPKEVPVDPQDVHEVIRRERIRREAASSHEGIRRRIQERQQEIRELEARLMV